MACIKRSIAQSRFVGIHNPRTILHGDHSLSMSLPFLYSTKTILRQYSDAPSTVPDALSEFEQQESRSKPERIQSSRTGRQTSSYDRRFPRGQPESKASGPWQSRFARPTNSARSDRQNNTRLYQPPSSLAERLDGSQDLLKSNFEDEQSSASPDRSSPRPHPRASARPGSLRALGHGRRAQSSRGYIPFDASVSSDIFEGSTITPKELAKFESLYQEGMKSGSFAGEALSLDEILDGAVEQHRREMAELTARPRRSLEAQTMDEATGDTPNAVPVRTMVDGQSQAAKKEIRSLREAIKNAQTDHELWNIVNTRVFASVKALQLDNPTIAERRERRGVEVKESPKAAKKRLAAGVSPSHDPGLVEEETVHFWAANLPPLLVYIIRIFSENFPQSPLALSLLPALKKLGPSEFALGASTLLFNRHMHLLFDKYSDIDGIVKTLEDMDRLVFPYDSGTVAVLYRVVAQGQRASRGLYGEGQKLAWSMERKHRALRSLMPWVAKVRDRVKTDALRKARGGHLTRFD